MADCSKLEPLFTPYVDGEATAADRAAIDAHLSACPPCRDRLAAERSVRETIVTRRDALRCCASPDLKRRCEAGRPVRPSPIRTGVFGRPLTGRRVAWLPLSLAATLLLSIAGVFLYGLRGGSEALAAQLVADHVKCFEFAPEPTILPDPRALAREWAVLRGWSLKVPESATAEQLELLGLRRCISTEGLTAHVMYKWKGQPLSVFVLNSDRNRIGPVPHLVERFGQEAIMWSKGGRTYAVVARGRAIDVEHVAKYVQTTAE
jgi:anti-sigma factor RsiW